MRKKWQKQVDTKKKENNKNSWERTKKKRNRTEMKRMKRNSKNAIVHTSDETEEKQPEINSRIQDKS